MGNLLAMNFVTQGIQIPRRDTKTLLLQLRSSFLLTLPILPFQLPIEMERRRRDGEREDIWLGELESLLIESKLPSVFLLVASSCWKSPGNGPGLPD